MSELSPLVKLLVILGVAKVTGERPVEHTKTTKRSHGQRKIPVKPIMVTLLIISSIIVIIVNTNPFDIKELKDTKSITPVLLSSDECLALQGEIESQASEFPNADYDKWKNSNCVKVCQDSIELNKYYKKNNFIEFLKDGCPFRKIIITDQECEKNEDTDEYVCRKIILGELQ